MKQRVQPPPSVLWVEADDDEPVVLRPPLPPRRRGRIAILLTLLVLVVGAAALDWLERESADPFPSSPAAGRFDAAATAASPAARVPTPAAPLDTIGIERRVFPPPPPRAARSRPAPGRTTPPRTTPVRRPLPPPVRAAPAAPGRLFVGATPWGDLYLDDLLVGHTPIAGVAIPAGVHRLRIVRDGFQSFDQVIQIAPGQDLRLTDITLRPLAP